MLHAKNYYNRPLFHETIQKNKSGTFFMARGVVKQ